MLRITAAERAAADRLVALCGGNEYAALERAKKKKAPRGVIHWLQYLTTLEGSSQWSTVAQQNVPLRARIRNLFFFAPISKG